MKTTAEQNGRLLTGCALVAVLPTKEEFPYTMPNRAALDYAKENQPELYDAYINSPITNTPQEVWEKGHWIQDVGEATPLYENMWTEIKGR